MEAVKSEQEKRKTVAHFWNLNEDPQLTNMVLHFIPPGLAGKISGVSDYKFTIFVFSFF